MGNLKLSFKQRQEENETRKKKEALEAEKLLKEFKAEFENKPSDDASHPISSSKKEKITLDQKTKSIQLSLNKHFLQDDSNDAAIPQPEINTQKKKKTKNLDLFLDELKKEQLQRESNSNFKVKESSEDHYHQSENTNLFVGNLPTLITEEELCYEFAYFGPIASVKIMKPRTAEEKEKTHVNGFVGFMTQAHAETALKMLDGKEYKGKTLHIAWSKPVNIPSKPIYARQDLPTARPFGASTANFPNDNKFDSKSNLYLNVKIPKNTKLLDIIHYTITNLLIYGSKYEMFLIEQTFDKDAFSFLRDFESPDHIYYRWKVYSLLNGDSLDRWSIRPFFMYENGPIFIPPPLPFQELISTSVAAEEEQYEHGGENGHESSSTGTTSSTDSDDDDDSNSEQGEDEQDYAQKHFLTSSFSSTLDKNTPELSFHKNRARLEIFLRNLTCSRDHICQVMVFCIRHSEFAEQIVELISESLCVWSTELSLKIARLYLLSDVLHNSNVTKHNAWKYRSVIESHCPVIFGHFKEFLMSFNSKLKSEYLRRIVIQLLNIWESWIVFPISFISSLKDLFVIKSSGSEVLQNEQPQAQQEKETPYEDIDGVPVEDEDLDGVPL